MHVQRGLQSTPDNIIPWLFCAEGLYFSTFHKYLTLPSLVGLLATVFCMLNALLVESSPCLSLNSILRILTSILHSPASRDPAARWYKCPGLKSQLVGLFISTIWLGMRLMH